MMLAPFNSQLFKCFITELVPGIFNTISANGIFEPTEGPASSNSRVKFSADSVVGYKTTKSFHNTVFMYIPLAPSKSDYKDPKTIAFQE